MSSPFQRSFSSKSPLNRGYKKIIDPHSGKGVAVDPLPVAKEKTLPESKPKYHKEVKPTLKDVMSGPMQKAHLPLEKMWNKAKSLYEAVDTPEERKALKTKLTQAWDTFKGPRSKKVG